MTIITIMLSLTVIQASANSVETPSINYGGHVNNGDGSYTFTYEVTSGTPVVKKWQLHSPCFVKGGPTITVIAQDPGDPMFEPHWNMNPGQNYIEFKHEADHQFIDGLTRTYYITVHTGDYYAGIGTGNVEYQLHWPPGTRIEGEITGPICAPEYVMAQTILGTTGPIIPLLAAAGLIASFKKNLISIKVT